MSGIHDRYIHTKYHAYIGNIARNFMYLKCDLLVSFTYPFHDDLPKCNIFSSVLCKILKSNIN